MAPPTPFLGAAPLQGEKMPAASAGLGLGLPVGGAPAGPPGGRGINTEATGVGPSPPASQGLTLE